MSTNNGFNPGGVFVVASDDELFVDSADTTPVLVDK